MWCFLSRCKRITPLSVILNGLRSGDLKLQMGITEFGTGMSLLLHWDREGSPTEISDEKAVSSGPLGPACL